MSVLMIAPLGVVWASNDQPGSRASARHAPIQFAIVVSVLLLLLLLLAAPALRFRRFALAAPPPAASAAAIPSSAQSAQPSATAAAAAPGPAAATPAAALVAAANGATASFTYDAELTEKKLGFSITTKRVDDVKIVVVKSCLAGSAAEVEGIAAGDVIESANGKEDTKGIISQMKSKKRPLHITLRRAAVPGTYTVELAEKKLGVSIAAKKIDGVKVIVVKACSKGTAAEEIGRAHV
jgi:S1-C subfamily serine protease